MRCNDDGDDDETLDVQVMHAVTIGCAMCCCVCAQI